MTVEKSAGAIIFRKEGEKPLFLLLNYPPASRKQKEYWDLPKGHIEKGENILKTVRREVFEETGLRVTGFKPDVRTKIHSQKDDEAFAFLPFCCQQQTRGKSRVGFVFICTVEDKEPVPGHGEVKDIRWIKKSELKKILEETPEKIFTFQLGVLDYYLNYDGHLHTSIR